MKRVICILLLCWVLLVACSPKEEVAEEIVVETITEEELQVEDQKDEVIENDNTGIEVRKDDYHDSIELIDEESRQDVSMFIDKGDYSIAESLSGVVDSYKLKTLKLLADTDDYYFFYGKGDSEVIISSDKSVEDLKIIMEKKTSSYVGFSNYDIIKNNRTNNQYMLRIINSKGYNLLNLDGKIQEEVLFPDAIKSELRKDGIRNWDLSDDCNMITYTYDQTGLELYRFDTNTFTHLIDNRILEEDDMGSEICGRPEFIMNDKYISTVEFGYEWVAGYNLYNIETQNITYLRGAIDLALDVNKDQGLYVYYDNTLKATLYDYSKDERVSRGLTGNFADAAYEGWNYLVDDMIITGLYRYGDYQFEINITEVSEKGKYYSIPLINFKNTWVDVVQPEIIFATEDVIYVIVPEAKVSQRVIEIPYERNELKYTLNRYYALDMVMFADGQVEIMGEKMAYGNTELSPLLEGLTMKQVEQLMYRSVLFYTSIYTKDFYALKQIASEELLESFDNWENNIEVDESTELMMRLFINSDVSFPDGLEAPIKTDDGYSVRLMMQNATVHLVIGDDGVPVVVGMDLK